MSKLNLAALVASAASAFHEQWRREWQSGKNNTVDTPKWKPTKDAAWLQANAASDFCRSGEVNINIPFPNLPSDWQADNQEAAEIAIPIAISAFEDGTIDSADYETVAAAQIHQAWLDRRRAAEGETDSFKKLDIPFDQLDKWEQDKDISQARISKELVLS